MHWSFVLLLGAAPPLGVIANPSATKRWSDLVEKHSWAEIPRGWEHVRSPDPEHILEMRIGLKQNRIDELIDSLYQISDPKHDRYVLLSSRWRKCCLMVRARQVRTTSDKAGS